MSAIRMPVESAMKKATAPRISSSVVISTAKPISGPAARPINSSASSRNVELLSFTFACLGRWATVEFPTGRDNGRGDFRIRCRLVQEYLITLYREHRNLAGAGRHMATREPDGMLPDEIRRGGDSPMLFVIAGARVLESPARDLLVDHGLAGARIHAGCGEHPAIVSSAGLGAMRVDRAPAVREHEAM